MELFRITTILESIVKIYEEWYSGAGVFMWILQNV